MARARGGDGFARTGGGAKGRGARRRQVFIFSEGEVTELEYIDIILSEGTWADPARGVDRHFENSSARGKHRKPLPMVQDAVRTLRKVERDAKNTGLREEDWNWPQVWVLFDRDEHPGILEARNLAEKERIKIAYSHPCFELWRLLHYQNYTSDFGGVCDDASALLRQQPGFARTYGQNVRVVSKQQAKHMKPEQVLRSRQLDRYATAKKYALKINEERGNGHPDTWDPYTGVWRFVEEGLLLSGY